MKLIIIIAVILAVVNLLPLWAAVRINKDDGREDEED